MALRGVLFDLGGTLLHYNAPHTSWEDTEKTGARVVYHGLQAAGYTLPPEAESLDNAWEHALTFWSHIVDHYDPKTLKLTYFVRSLAARWQVDSLPEPLVESLSAAYIRAIQAHVHPLDSAAHTLRALQDRGLRIGLISNTLWPGAAHLDDLQRHGLIDYIQRPVFSADVEAWKPHRAVFELGLNAIAVAPDETFFVGDALYHDIWGAQQAGLRAVWIEQPRFWVPDGLTVTPDATIRRLPELLDIVSEWQ